MGRIEDWRDRQELRARARAARFKELDGQLRETLETREVPRSAKLPLPEAGTLPAEVAVLVDDGQIRRGVNLLANLCGIETEEADAAVGAYVRGQGGRDPASPG